ncbi:PilZ domain-containing protein [Rhizobium sp. CFBP 8762]|uniref:PilZ domain-containing protein n=1 Tax=Rhizobium sp. CFBP 8762 TaxID=2775279 RepID=UPI001786D02D|nr:PilZ domain-containing protein [Rhizobium sp. CFBP 8762]MBD8555702.1 PilZ domain-containing protein [Rhizobium sp. CFBP 8762]
MQSSLDSSVAKGPSSLEQRSFQRVTVSLPGRLMTESRDEFACQVTEMSPGDVYITCTARPRFGENIIAYVEQIGRLEGPVCRLADHAFVLRLTATDRKRTKLAAQLTWIANRHELGLPEDRRHDRLTPRRTRTDITLPSGEKIACRIIDLSLSGAAVDLEIRPNVGTAITLGTMRGHIVRHFAEGVAIEFSAVQSKDALTAFI